MVKSLFNTATSTYIHMNSIEERAVAVFDQLWIEWGDPSAEGIQRALAFYADDYHGFGSAPHELWRGIEDMKSFYEKSGKQNPNGFSVKTKWIETRLISEKVVSAWGELTITIQQKAKKIVIDPMRITVLFRENKGKMEVVQSHGSLPDMTQIDEIWPGTGKPKRYNQVSILFTDFVGFTKSTANISAERLVSELNEIFAEFDKITLNNGLEKIKTIGDSYMAAGGLYDQESGQAMATVRTGREMLSFLKARNEISDLPWRMRIGIHSGPVVGGVIGTEKLRFDLWGETVNLASRIESTSEADRINISAVTYKLIKNYYRCEYRGKILTKDKDLIDMYFVR